MPTNFEEIYRDDRKVDVFLPVPECDVKLNSTRFRGQVDGTLVRHWIRQCGTNHVSCCSAPGVSYPSESILIDVEEMRLYEKPSDTQPKYLTLSYIWGDVQQSLLTQANYERWQKQGALRNVKIPRTVRDAIELTQMIGYRYLWVDALCIVQDDDSIRHHQISQMHQIYQQAELTIIAADAKHCDQGLSGISTMSDRTRRHQTYQLPGTSFMRLPLSTRRSLETSPWRTRGWTFQEELCSRRALTVLPELMLFTCPSATWREDMTDLIDSGPSFSLDSQEGPLLLAPMLRGKQENPLDTNQAIVLFQDLAKQYMHRSLKRSDDIENAFAGVAGMLEDFLGTVHHGIPERCFDEIIHGCWHWDTCLQRRPGFPSWSWTGWIYHPERAEAGIRAPKGMNNMLVFYKVGSDFQLLSQPPERNRLTSVDSPHIWEHFDCDEDSIRAQHLKLKSDSNVPKHLVAFFTSVVTLKLRKLYRHSASQSDFAEYLVVHPVSQKKLTSIQLSSDFVDEKGLVHPFIVIACDLTKAAFRLMLVSFQDSIAERVNVTASNCLVTVYDWLSLTPRKELVVMG